MEYKQVGVCIYVKYVIHVEVTHFAIVEYKQVGVCIYVKYVYTCRSNALCDCGVQASWRVHLRKATLAHINHAMP